MHRIGGLAYLLCAVLTAAALTGCGKEISANDSIAPNPAENSSAESTADQFVQEPDTSDGTVLEDDSIPDSEIQQELVSDNEPGELLTRTAELMSGEFTLVEKKSYSDTENDFYEVTTASDGERVFIHNAENAEEGFSSDNYYIRTKDENGLFEDRFIEKMLGLYALTDMDGMKSAVLDVYNGDLAVTSGRIPEETNDMTVEEYTYTGETYITVYDFFFDNEGELKKYTVCWSVEGEDDLVMTSEIVSFDEGFDESLFDLDSLTIGLKDFDALTAEERESFCREICVNYDIYNDDLFEQGFTSDSLGNIGCLDFVKLVYTYAK